MRGACSPADAGFLTVMRTFPLPKPSQLPSCLHCPVRQRLTYFRQYPTAPHSPFTPPPSTALSDVFPSQPASLTFCSIKNRHPFPNDDFSSTIFLTAIQNMIPTLTQTITFSFLFYSGFHPDIFLKIPAYSLPAVEYFKTYSVSVLHPISQLP